MIAVDTNVLLRILVDDPDNTEQNRAARELSRRAGQVFVPLLAAVECVWVLESAYQQPRTTVVDVLQHMLDNSAFVLEGRDRFAAALEHYRTDGIDFADGVILATVRGQSLGLHTFDRRLSRLPGVTAVKAL